MKRSRGFHQGANGARRREFGSHAAGTVKQLVRPTSRGHGPRFDRVLPGMMKRLVAEGLFVADASADGGYRITERGRARLREIEGGGE